MRWFRNILIIILLLAAVYTLLIHYFSKESETYNLESKVEYPVDEVFSQFNNFQNLVQWNTFFTSNDKMVFNFFLPYEGEGSSMSFKTKKSNKAGEIFLRKETKNHYLQYDLFKENVNHPLRIEIKFDSITSNRTKIDWKITTPKLSFFERSSKFWEAGKEKQRMESSLIGLKNRLQGRVNKEKQLNAIRYDSIFQEVIPQQLLLGENSSISTKHKENVSKNFIMKHNEVFGFLTLTLDKEEDNLNFPILVTNPQSFRDRDFSFFYGFPIDHKVDELDNSFTYQNIEKTNVYSIFYKGNYEGRQISIQKLLNKAKNNDEQIGKLYETFITPPEENKTLIIKLSLAVSE